MRALSRWEVIINFTSLLQKRHENMSPCTGFYVNTNYERIASRAGCQLRTRALMSQATPRPTAGSSVLETQPWPIRQKRIGTSRMVGITHPAQQSILGRNDSPLGHLHLALAYRYSFYYIFSMEEAWEHFSMQWHQGEYQSWVECFICWMPGINKYRQTGFMYAQVSTGPIESIFHQVLL